MVGWATLDPLWVPEAAAAGSGLHSPPATSSGQHASTPSSVHLMGYAVGASVSAGAGEGIVKLEEETVAAGEWGAAAALAAGSAGRAAVAEGHADSGCGNGAGVDESIAANRDRRQLEQVDYEEDKGPVKPPRGIDFRGMAAAIISGDYEEVERVAPEDLRIESLLGSGFRQPLLIGAGGSTAATLKALGMRLPAAPLSAESICAALGPDHKTNTWNVKWQKDGPVLPLSKWAAYFRRTPAQRLKLLNVVSLRLAGTPLEGQVVAPAVVRALDLVARVWPAKQQPQPQVLLYALMSPEGAYTDFHVDFGGSSVWYHIVSGCKVFLVFPPTPHNLAAFEQWASSDEQSTSFFANLGEGALRLTVEAGETLLLPAGWPHAVATLQDTVAVGGNFLHGLGLRQQLEVYEMEGRLNVSPSCRFPMFKELYWYTAEHYLGLLQAAVRAGVQGNVVNRWEVEGLGALKEGLERWSRRTRRAGSIPASIQNPADFMEELSTALTAVEAMYLHSEQEKGRAANPGRDPSPARTTEPADGDQGLLGGLDPGAFAELEALEGLDASDGGIEFGADGTGIGGFDDDDARLGSQCDAMYSDARLAPHSSNSTLHTLGSSGSLTLEAAGVLPPPGLFGSLTAAAKASAIRTGKAEALGLRPAGSALTTAQPPMVQTSAAGGGGPLPGGWAVPGHNVPTAKPSIPKPATEGKVKRKAQEAAAAEEQPSLEAIETDSSSADESIPLAERLQKIREVRAAAAGGQQKGSGPQAAAKKRGKPSGNVKPAGKPSQKRRLSLEDSMRKPQPSDGGSPQLKGPPSGGTAVSDGQKGGSVPAQADIPPEFKPEIPAYRRDAPVLMKPGGLAHPGMRSRDAEQRRQGSHAVGGGGGGAGGRSSRDPRVAAAASGGPATGPGAAGAGGSSSTHLEKTIAMKHADLTNELKLQERVASGGMQLADNGARIGLRISHLRRDLRDLGRPDLADMQLGGPLKGGAGRGPAQQGQAWLSGPADSREPLGRPPSWPLTLPHPGSGSQQGSGAYPTPAHDARGEASTLFDAGRQWSGGHPGQQGQPHYSSGQQIGKPGGIGDRRGGSYNGSRSSGKATQAAPDERGGTNSRKDRSHPHDRRRANRSRSPSRSPSRSQSRSPSRERRGHPQSQPRPTARKWGHEQARPANERWHSGGAPSSPIANGAAFVQQAQQEPMDDQYGACFFINGLGAEEGPFTVAEMREKFERGAIDDSTLINEEEEGVSMILARLLQKKKERFIQQHPLPPPYMQPAHYIPSPPRVMSSAPYIPSPPRRVSAPASGHRHRSAARWQDSGEELGYGPPQGQQRQHQQQQQHRRKKAETVSRRKVSESSAGGPNERRWHGQQTSSDAVDMKEPGQDVHAYRAPPSFPPCTMQPTPLPAVTTADGRSPAAAAAAVSPAQPESPDAWSPLPWEEYSPTATAAAAELSTFAAAGGGATDGVPAAASGGAEGAAGPPAAAAAAAAASDRAVGTVASVQEPCASPPWQPPLPPDEPPPLEHLSQRPAAAGLAQSPAVCHPAQPMPAASSFQGTFMQLPAHLAAPISAPHPSSRRAAPVQLPPAMQLPLPPFAVPITQQDAPPLPPPQQQPGVPDSKAFRAGVGAPAAVAWAPSFGPMVRVTASQAAVPSQLPARQPQAQPQQGDAAPAEGRPASAGGAPGGQTKEKPMMRRPQRQMPHAVPMGPMRPGATMHASGGAPRAPAAASGGTRAPGAGYNPFDPQPEGYDPFATQAQGYDPFAAHQPDRNPIRSPAMLLSPTRSFAPHSQQAQQGTSAPPRSQPAAEVQSGRGSSQAGNIPHSLAQSIPARPMQGVRAKRPMPYAAPIEPQLLWGEAAGMPGDPSEPLAVLRWHESPHRQAPEQARHMMPLHTMYDSQQAEHTQHAQHVQQAAIQTAQHAQQLQRPLPQEMPPLPAGFGQPGFMPSQDPMVMGEPVPQWHTPQGMLGGTGFPQHFGGAAHQ